MSLTGRCDCGATTYAVAAEGVNAYACHCLNCQTRSGSAFALHAMIPAEKFTCDGATVTHVRKSGDMEITEVFCATCHTRISNSNTLLAGMVFLQVGTLDNSDRIQPFAHIWTSRKQPWIALPDGIATFDQSPLPEDFGAALAAAPSAA